MVIDGNLNDIGMVSFADVLTPEDAEAIRAYVVTQAHMKEAQAEMGGNDGGGQ